MILSLLDIPCMLSLDDSFSSIGYRSSDPNVSDENRRDSYSTWNLMLGQALNVKGLRGHSIDCWYGGSLEGPDKNQEGQSPRDPKRHFFRNLD